MRASYVLPLRWREPWPVAELAAYLRWVGREVDEVVVVLRYGVIFVSSTSAALPIASEFHRTGVG